MKDDRPPLEPADEEELRAAAALARALEGGADEPDLPQSALETAALLRLSAGVELDSERSKAIKNELLAGLPARSERRRRSLLPEWTRALPRWLFLALPLGGTAVLCLLLLVKSPEPEARFSAQAFPDRAFVEQMGAKGDGAGRTSVSERAPLAASEAPAAPLASSPVLDSPEARQGAAARSELGTAHGQALAMPEPEGSSADSYATGAPGGLLRRTAPKDDSDRGVGSLGGSVGGGGRSRREAMVANADRASSSAPSPAGNAASAASGRLLASPPSARAALTGLDQEVRAERTQLLARTNDAELSRAHTELDGAQSRAELERSRANLTRLLETTGNGLGADDARQVRQDLYCRLAETALRLGEPRAALEWARRGIELDGPPSPFLAQLMALEGDALAALGEPSSAANSYMRALRVHEALLDESLDGH